MQRLGNQTEGRHAVPVSSGEGLCPGSQCHTVTLMNVILHHGVSLTAFLGSVLSRDISPAESGKVSSRILGLSGNVLLLSPGLVFL